MRGAQLLLPLLLACASSDDMQAIGSTASFLSDGGVVSSAERGATNLDPSPRNGLFCERVFPEFLCGGYCPHEMGCCITGVRPLGVCRSSSSCGNQCLNDCSLAARRYGAAAVAQCESLCTFVEPQIECRLRPE